MFLEKQILQWARETYGEVAVDTRERALRVVEEAVELAQALGVEDEMVRKAVIRVHNKPAGDPKKELGDLALTVFALHGAMNQGVRTTALDHFATVLDRPAEDYRAKHRAKQEAGTAYGQVQNPG